MWAEGTPKPSGSRRPSDAVAACNLYGLGVDSEPFLRSLAIILVDSGDRGSRKKVKDRTHETCIISVCP